MSKQTTKPIKSTPKITAKQLQERIEFHVKYSLSKRVCEAHKEHLFLALAMAIRDLCIDNMFETAKRHQSKDPKRVYYLSLEYLLGRLLPNNLYNFEIMDLLEDGKNDIGLISEPNSLHNLEFFTVLILVKRILVIRFATYS